MATNTSFLNLTKPATSDSMSPAPFNGNSDIIDNAVRNLSVDYVTSTGTIDGWRFRRWHSGFCEAWKTGVRAAYANNDYLKASQTFPFTLSSQIVNASAGSMWLNEDPSRGVMNFVMNANAYGTTCDVWVYRIGSTWASADYMLIDVFVSGWE